MGAIAKLLASASEHRFLYTEDIEAALSELAALQERVKRLEVALRDVEWSGEYLRAEDGSALQSCPWCGRAKRRGHDKGCGLAAALEQSK